MIFRLAGRVLAHLLFWGWNLLFLVLVVFGLGPKVVLGMVLATANGLVPWHVTAFGLALVALPALGLALGAWKLRRDPGRLLALFYGVQAPLMLLCLVRLFAIQALTPATGLLLLGVGVGSLGLLRTVLHGPTEDGALAQAGRQVAQTTGLLIGLWWALLVAGYALPLALHLGDAALDGLFRWYVPRPSELFWLLAGSAFALSTAGLLLVFPAAMLGISARASQLVHRETSARLGRGGARALAATTLGGLLLAFGLASRQEQAGAFALLDAAVTDDARRDAVAESDRVRRGLLDARLSAERWFDADPEGEHVRALWEPLVGAGAAEAPRALWRGLTWPFVYRPVHDGRIAGSWWTVPADVGEAPQAYARFFDAPMERAEREALLAALRQTWSWEDAEASLLEIGERKVHLERQDIAVRREGDVAVITIHDVYRNRTWSDQEVWLSFSLPDGAVPTGLWLGHGPDRDEAFAFVVAPRGAAQEVYEREVRRRVDPALLEQVGPRQYRLRAFPVPRREGEADEVWAIGSEGPPLHLWLELVAPLADGGFALPEVAEARNLFWDAATVRTLDGAPIAADDWVPARIPAEGAPGAHLARVGRWIVAAEPAGAVAPRRTARLAVLVDGTRSMEARRDALADALTRLRGAADEVLVLCTVEQRLRRCDGFDPSTALFWGSEALETRLVEAGPLAAGADALVVLTDPGSYELAAAAERQGLPDVALPPLWLVHLSGMAIAYPDWTADRMQRTGGGAVASVDELLTAWADPAIAGGWRWTFTEAQEDAGAPSDGFGRLAARQLVAHLDRDARAHGVDHLDALHAVAVGARIVTPYSSMIVLVEERQREALAEAEQGADRFDREVTAEPEPMVVSAAPEPASALLLLLGGGLFAARRWRG